MLSIYKTARKLLANQPPIYAVVLLLFLLSWFFVPDFQNPVNILNILVQSSDLIIIACGTTFVILNGGIDFSITATLGLGSVVGATIVSHNTHCLADSPFGMPIAVGVMISIGLLIGVINGYAVTKLKMPSFMATMAVYLIFSGLAVFYTKSDSVGNLSSSFTNLGDGSILFIPIPICVAAAVVAATHYVLTNTVFGRYVYAVGTNPRTAFISGVPVKRTIFKLFTISGFLAAVSGIIQTARIGSGSPALGRETLLDIVTAVIIGGTSIFGGSGTIFGTVAGAFFIMILNNSLNLLGTTWYYNSLIKGVTLLGIALIDAMRRLNE